MAYRAGFTKVCFVDVMAAVRSDPNLVNALHSHSFDRLLVFNFVHYSIVVYMDVDIYILRDGLVHGMIEQERRLRSQGKTLACRKEIAHTYCNGGVLFVRPDADTFHGIRALGSSCMAAQASSPWAYRNVANDIIPVPQGLQAKSRVCKHDQALVNAYFTIDSNNAFRSTVSKDTLTLPSMYNTILYEAHQEYGAWTMQDMREMGVVALHYVSPKPWTTWECNAWWVMGEICQYWRDAPIEPSNLTGVQFRWPIH